RIYESSYSLAASPQLLTQSALAKAKGVVASGLAKGRPLFLRAAWLDASGTASPLSNEIDVLPPPQSLDVIPYSGGALVQWQSNLQTNMPVLGYAVYVTPGAGLPIDASTDTAYAFVYSPTFATNTASAVVKGLVPNNPYSFAVAAVTGARQWWTGTASASVGAGANMAFPTISEAKSVTLSPTTTGLQINWLASTDYAGSTDTAIAAATTVTYELRAVDAPPTATDPSQGVTRTVASTTNTAAVDVSRPAAASQEWYYVYVSVTGQGVGSSLASLTTAAGMVSLPVLDAPTMITATSVDNGRVQLSWSTVNSADHYQILRSTQGAAFAALADGLLSSLTGSGQSMSWIDAEAINNTPNAYEVEALLGLPPGVGGPAIPSAASNVVTGTPSVLPDMPGPSYMNVVAANGSDFQTVSGHAITAVASVTVPGEIDLVWASSGPGSAPVTGYQVLRGNSPDPTQMSYLTTVAALPATSTALVRYADGP
ncbi:MAG TPA: fibronectin type III domain-containing protein, partial [bacterium]|nr:fibronectin type III domain-containing protein [bacterium]